MRLRKLAFVVATIGLLAFAPLAAQRPSPSTSTPTGTAGKSPKQEPCWEQAGISKSVQEQRQTIQQGVRSQIQAVCQESNLSQQQKRQKIHEIRQEERQKIDALIPAGQRQTLEACRRSHGAQGGMHAGGQGTDPCAGLGH